MRGRSAAATAVLIGALALAAGCSATGQGASPTARPAAPSRATPSQPAPSGTAPSGTALPQCVPPRLTGRTFTIGVPDNGKSLCVTAGTGIFVFLHGTAAHRWTAIHPSSAAVQQRPSGVMALTIGTTGGYFVASQPGVATLSSTRRPCQRTCVAEMFRVTLVISGKA